MGIMDVRYMFGEFFQDAEGEDKREMRYATDET